MMNGTSALALGKAIVQLGGCKEADVDQRGRNVSARTYDHQRSPCSTKTAKAGFNDTLTGESMGSRVSLPIHFVS